LDVPMPSNIGAAEAGLSFVRARFAAIGTSLIAHVLAIAWFAASDEAPAAPARVVPPAPPADLQPLPLEPTPTEVVLVPMSIESAPLPPDLAPPPRAKMAPRAMSSDVRPPAIEETYMDRRPDDSSRSMLAMRGRDAARPPDLGLSSRSIQTILEHQAETAPEHPPAPPPPAPGSAAHANDQRIRDLEVALANPAFHEAAGDFEVERARGELESLRKEREVLELHPAGGGRYRQANRRFIADVDPDGSVHVTDQANVKGQGIGLSFDVNDALMRAVGQDPYWSAKLHFLDKTRDERVAIGNRFRAAQLAQSAAYARHAVDRLWATTDDLAKRKQGLFDLWDDCAETGEDAVVEGGRAAREMIVGEIRARLKGIDAYTADELAQLNAHKRSKALFAPYE
jgi:hypothetical protein